MKKITLLTAFVTVCSFLSGNKMTDAFAQSKVQQMPYLTKQAKVSFNKQVKASSNLVKTTKYGKLKTINNSTNNAKKLMAAGDTAFYDDFSNPADWTISADWIIGTNADDPGGANTLQTWIGPITSSTAGNGYAFINEIQYLVAGAPVIKDVTVAWTSAPIDLSANAGVLLTFEQNYRAFNSDEVYVEVSNDSGLTWTSFQVNSTIAANNYGPLSITLNISAVAGGSPNVFVRFRWVSTSADPSFGGGYGWMVDDVTITEAPNNDLTLEPGVTYLDPWLTPLYTQIPFRQVGMINFAGRVRNNGSAAQTNVTLNAIVNDGVNNVFNGNSPSISLNILEDSLLTVTQSYNALSIGTYTIDFTVSSDSTDFNPGDNTATESFGVSDTVYARDGGVQQFELNAAFYIGVDPPYEFANWYETSNADTATSISVMLGASTIVGTLIQGKIYDQDLATLLESTAFYTILPADPGTWITLPLVNPLPMAALSNFGVSIADFSGTDTATTISGQAGANLGTSFVYDGTTAQFYNINQTPFIRLNLKSPGTICALSATLPTATSVSCGGSSDGAIAGITGTGGTAPYTYAWSPGSSTAPDTSGVSAGIYTLTITDANSCQYTVAVDVTEPDPVALTLSTVLGCFGDSVGLTINASASGGSLLPIPVPPVFTENFEGVTIPALPPGWATYGNVGSDFFMSGDNTTANGAGFFPVTPHTKFAYSNDDVCNCDKAGDYLEMPSINLTGLFGYQLTFEAFNDNQQYGDASFVDVSTDGGVIWNPIYTIPPIPFGTWQSLSVDLSAYDNLPDVRIRFHYDDQAIWGGGLAIDDIVVEKTPVPLQYQFSIDTGATFQTASTFTGLTAGSYSIIVKDVNNCTDTTGITIADPPALILTLDSTVAACGNNIGTASVLVTGGVGAYTYLWSNGETTIAIDSLAGGVYDVVVTDANGCQDSAVVSVPTTPAVTLSLAAFSNPTSCITPDGLITVTSAGGTAPFIYQWSTFPVQDSSTATGLSSGSYSVVVTDVNSCTDSLSQSLVDASAPTLLITGLDNVKCKGGSDGSATVTPTGGTPGYNFVWNTFPVQIDSIATGLIAGTYVIEVTDAGGCVVTDTITISEPALALTASAVVTNVTINGGSDGSIVTTVIGGTGGYTHLWDIGATTKDIFNIPAGTYSDTITDANGCTFVLTQIVTEPVSIAEVGLGLTFNIYPNPTNGQFIVEFSNQKKDDYLIEVKNIIGQLIYSEEIDNIAGEFTKQIDLSEHRGVYFLSISNSSGTRTEKLIVY